MHPKRIECRFALIVCSLLRHFLICLRQINTSRKHSSSGAKERSCNVSVRLFLFFGYLLFVFLVGCGADVQLNNRQKNQKFEFKTTPGFSPFGDTPWIKVPSGSPPPKITRFDVRDFRTTHGKALFSSCNWYPYHSRVRNNEQRLMTTRD